MEKQYDIFISYRREDGAEFAEGLSIALKSKGYRVFFDKSSLQIGSDFPAYIASAIKMCREFIAIVTPSYCGRGHSGSARIHNEDDWVCKEIEIALSGDDTRIIPISVDCNPPSTSEVPSQITAFCDKNFISYNRSYDTYERVIEHIVPSFSENTQENAIISILSNKLATVDVNDGKSFNIVCKDIARYLDDARDERILAHILEKKDPEAYYYEQSYRYVVFYTLFSYYRRTHQVAKVIALVERFGGEFAAYPFTQYVYTEFWHTKYKLETDESVCSDYIVKMIAHAKKAIQMLPDNNGILHSYALSVARAKENGVDISQDDFSRALTVIHKIMESDPEYALYHCTYARLLASEGKYQEALMNLKLAQALEKPGHKDWVLRISDYRRHELIIRISQAVGKQQTSHNFRIDLADKIM